MIVEALAVIPAKVLRAAYNRGLRVIACRDSVVDACPELRDVSPRGWPAGMIYRDVPGTFDLMRKGGRHFDDAKSRWLPPAKAIFG